MGDEVIRLEVGGVLEAGGDPVNVEAGMPEHEFGWSDCTVVRFLQEDSCGLLQADQAHGDIQFEAPEEVRGQDLRNFRVSAHIFIGADGQPQANEVRLGASSSSSAGRGGKWWRSHRPEWRPLKPVLQDAAVPVHDEWGPVSHAGWMFLRTFSAGAADVARTDGQESCQAG